MGGDQGWPKLLTSSYKLDQFGELKGKKNPFLISFFFFSFFFFLTQVDGTWLCVSVRASWA